MRCGEMLVDTQRIIWYVLINGPKQILYAAFSYFKCKQKFDQDQKLC